MKYSSSPSPMIESALPTPPHSPTEGALVPKAVQAVSVLDSLTSFYQQERYWVHHTRAALELALTKGIDAPALVSSSDSDSAPSPASSSSTLCDSPPPKSASLAVSIKAEPMDVDNTALNSPSSENGTLKSRQRNMTLNLSLSVDAQTRASRWGRRKNAMRLKLDGINSQPHRTGAHNLKRRRPHKAPVNEPGARLLEMFSELVDSRMESCQRVSRMLQDSNRQQYCY